MTTKPTPWICGECREPCLVVEERIDYAGTHCTHGNSGVHYTGYYESDCCFADYILKEGDDDNND